MYYCTLSLKTSLEKVHQSKYSNNVNIYIYIYIYNSCTWAYDLRLHIAGTNESKSALKAKEGACYKWL